LETLITTDAFTYLRTLLVLLVFVDDLWSGGAIFGRGSGRSKVEEGGGTVGAQRALFLAVSFFQHMMCSARMTPKPNPNPIP